MSNQAVNIAITGNASSLVTAAKTGEKAIDELGVGAKDAGKKIDDLGKESKETTKEIDGLSKGANSTGKQIDGMGKEAVQTEREVEGLGRGARTTGSEVEAFGQKAEKAARSTTNLGRASHGIRTAGKMLALGSEKIVNQYTTLAGGAGIGLALKKQVELNDQIAQMGIAARDSNTGMVEGKSFAAWAETTKRSVMDVSKATGQGAEELTAGMQAIIQRTGNMKLATDNLKLMGDVATASGASVEEVGALVANLDQKAGIKGTDQMRQAITLLLAQGKSGAFELKDMVTNGERLFSVMNLFGTGGTNGLKSFGAFVQMARTSTGSSEQASTAIERLGSFMSNIPKIQKHLAGVGINVKLDPKADMETNIKKIITASKGDLKKLTASQAFGEEGIRAISTFANEFAAGRGFQMFDAFKDAGGDITKNIMLQQDFATRVLDSKFQFDRLVATMRDFGDKTLSGPLVKLTEGMDWINKHGSETEMTLKAMGIALAGFAAIAATVKVAGVVGQFASLIRGGAGGRLGGVAGAVGGAGATHVWVDNMGGGMGGMPGAAGRAVAAEEAVAAQAAKRGLLARAGGWIASTTPNWIKTTGGFIGNTAKGGFRSVGQFGSGVAERAEMWAYQNGAKATLSRLGGFGANALRFGGKALGGAGWGAAFALPFELYSNPDKMRAFVAAGGAGLGGFAGGSLGTIGGLGVASAPLGFAGGVGGSIAGRKMAVTLYDFLSRPNPNLQQAAAQSNTASEARARSLYPANQFAPTFQIFNQIDPQGRTTTRVEGPGVAKFDVLSSPLAPGWGL